MNPVVLGRLPMRWPGEWRNPDTLELVRKTPVNTLIIEENQQLAAVVRRAKEIGLTVLDAAHLPEDVHVVNGEWPGVRTAQESGAGPTGLPWLDANAWRVRLAKVMHPGKEIWVKAERPKRIVTIMDHLVAAYDAAMAGGKWILQPDGADKQVPPIAEVASPSGPVKAAIGVMSTFTGDHEFLSTEMLNLLGRAHQPVRILLPGATIPELAALVYCDGQLPAQVVDFARDGGLVVATQFKPAAAAVEEHARFRIYPQGKGRLAVCKDAGPDPYQLAADVQVLMSHRNDPVRFWNAGSIGSQLNETGKGLLLQIVNYASRPSNNDISVRVRGEFRRALVTGPGIPPGLLQVMPATNGTEIRVPPIGTYLALELS